jgi:hypothetical protein
MVALPTPAVRMRVFAPLTVLDKTIFPAPAPVLNVVEAVVSEMGAAKLRFWFAVVMFAPKVTVPDPVCVNDPLTEKAAPTFSPPLSEIVTGPLSVVVTVPKKENAPLVTEIPLAVVVAIVSVNVDVPVPADWSKNPAKILFAVTLFALEIVNDERGVVPPTSLTKEILPVPAANVRAKAPSSVLLIVISPPAAPEFKVIGPKRVSGPVKVIGWLFVVTEPL